MQCYSIWCMADQMPSVFGYNYSLYGFSLLLPQSCMNTHYGARLSSPYHRHSLVNRYNNHRDSTENMDRQHFMRSLRDRVEDGHIRDMSVVQEQRLRRLEDLEQQVERSVPWNGDSWRNRVREYLEKRRSSKEVTK